MDVFSRGAITTSSRYHGRFRGACACHVEGRGNWNVAASPSAQRVGRADTKAKGVKFGRKPKLTPHEQREAIRRRDMDGETLRSIGRSNNVSPQLTA